MFFILRLPLFIFIFFHAFLNAQESEHNIGGWLQPGYTSKSTGIFNVNEERLNLSQAWIYYENPVQRDSELNFGGRIDYMYGSDAFQVQAFGNEPGSWDYKNGADRGAGYGFAVPQIYMEAAKDNYSIKAGHFFSPLGYEGVDAVSNFFYSHSFTSNFSTANTHFGALSSISTSEDQEIFVGWTAGWDTAFQSYQGGSSFLGGFSQKLASDTTLTFYTSIGDFGWYGEGYAHSIIFEKKLSESFDYVFESNYTNTNFSNEALTPAYTNGVTQYFIFKLNEYYSVGSRFEIWQARDDIYHATTFGLNYTYSENIRFRPEIRFQGSEDIEEDETSYVPINKGEIIAADLILSF